MDPTAPNDPNNSTGTPQSPIQPGQFVVAGAEPEVAPTVQTQTPQEAATQPANPTVNLAQDKSTNPQVFPNAPVSPASTQPDPTPFTPPMTSAQTQNTSTAQVASGSKSGKKTILIILALLILVAIIGTVSYFFVIPIISKKTPPVTIDTQVESATPPPAPGGGFGSLPESSDSSQVPGSTPSSIPGSTSTSP